MRITAGKQVVRTLTSLGSSFVEDMGEIERELESVYGKY